MKILNVRTEVSSGSTVGTVSFEVPDVGLVSGPASSTLVYGRMSVSWDLHDATTCELLGRALGQSLADWQGPNGTNVELDDEALQGLIRTLADGVDGQIEGYRFPGASEPPSTDSRELGAALFSAASECKVEPDVRLGAGFDLSLQEATLTVEGEDTLLDDAQKEKLCSLLGEDWDGDVETEQVRIQAPDGATIVIDGSDGDWSIDELEITADGGEVTAGTDLEEHGITVTRVPIRKRTAAKKKALPQAAPRKKPAGSRSGSDAGDDDNHDEEPPPQAAPRNPPQAAARKKPTSVTRRFEFSEGTSNKFWEITVSGSSFTTRHGRIGTDGTEVAKSFDSAEETGSEADKLVREKLKKGYSEK